MDESTTSGSKASQSEPSKTGTVALRPSDRIFFAFVDGIVVILDRTTDSYFALNERASTIWRALLKGEMVVDQETSDFIADCHSRGLLVEMEAAPAKPAKSRPASIGLLACAGLWTLLAIRSLQRSNRQLRRHGFSFAHTDHEVRCAGLPATRPVADLDRALAAFYRAESVVPMPGAPDDCLPRSLALFAYLRSLCFPAEHLIGVRRYPSLTMHAWVEVDGYVVADREEAKEFVPIARFGTNLRDS